ncbi:MAG TPA: NfeD family protein [Actinomycetota bacterium]
MRRVGAVLIVASALVPVFAANANATPASLVDVVKVEGAVDRTMNDYLRGTIADAEAAHSTLVLQIDTAGTLDVDPLALGDLVARASVPVIVWVGSTPAQAAGAGLLLVYASSLAAVAPGAATGPLQPVDLGHPDAYPTAQVRAFVARWQTMHGRSPTVRFPDHALTGAEAEQAGIIQTDAFTVPQLLSKVDGQTVQTANGRVTLDTAGSPGDQVLVRFHDLGPGKRVLHAVASPTWIYVLLVFGLAAIAFELTQPGFGFAGFSGVGMLALGVYGLTAVPVFWPGLVLLLAGIGLMVADVLVRRLGWRTYLGLVTFVAGSVLAFGNLAPAIQISPWLIGATVVASLLYYGFGLTVAIQSRERITSTQRGLVGLPGETRGELAPEGPVFVKGTLWKGRSSDGPIPPGTRIRVRGVDGLILRVEPEEEEEGDTP